MKKGISMLLGILIALIILTGVKVYMQKTKQVNVNSYFNSTSVTVTGNDNIVNVEDE